MRTYTLVLTSMLIACGAPGGAGDAGPGPDAGQVDERCTRDACAIVRASCSSWSLPTDVEARAVDGCFALPGEIGDRFEALCQSICQRTGGGAVHECVIAGTSACDESTRDYCEGPGWCGGGETCTARRECENRTAVDACLPNPDRDPVCVSACGDTRESCESGCPASSSTIATCLDCTAECEVGWARCLRLCEG